MEFVVNPTALALDFWFLLNLLALVITRPRRAWVKNRW